MGRRNAYPLSAALLSIIISFLCVKYFGQTNKHVCYTNAGPVQPETVEMQICPPPPLALVHSSSSTARDLCGIPAATPACSSNHIYMSNHGSAEARQPVQNSPVSTNNGNEPAPCKLPAGEESAFGGSSSRGICAVWMLTGFCKFGNFCRNAHPPLKVAPTCRSRA